ncbi:DMT family transporter [Microbacterium sp. SSW1-59]|uniref:DMT family transporter n=1 Tax=Microbacterium xanthum TaxID=3079794 RepID=UPI002AD3D64A|nr:DMT family transporter [Microbacterium sp. SSW1-59]MDZ8200248.1 DMT family transporter [Microbacterium sp. SSW1-59]
MSTLTNDARVGTAAGGVAFALVAAVAFGLSGSLGKGLLEIGWTAGAATLVRVAIAAALLAAPGLIALRGRWPLLRRALPTVLLYGLFAVAGAQLCFFFAVEQMDVGVALLVEYTAPVAVVLWLWLRRGQRPHGLTVAGAVVAALGLLLLLGILGGVSVSLAGIAWALGAMVGLSVYYLVSGDDSHGLPPVTLAAGGLSVAVVLLALAAVVGVLPIGVGTGTVAFVGFDAPWWVVVLLLGAVTGALSYVSGIAAARRLGARLASFVGLTEVLAAALLAWLLLGETPQPVQVVGGVLVLVGVVLVKLAESRGPAPSTPPRAWRPHGSPPRTRRVRRG